jgi:hypothetical protein
MTNDASIIAELETALNHFDPAVRANSLRQLTNLVRQGAISLPPECDRVNMHCHSFFSFNALGHSPTSLAWLGKQQGLKGMGIIDFDVLDGVGEFLDACEQVGMRGSAGIETRLFIPELADRVINSLGEPGVCYHMGIGFTSSRAPDNVAGILDDLRRRASQRNRAIVTYVNSYLDPVTIDYEQDVLPLTPGGNPTERHLVVAYILAAERKVADPLGFWSAKLDVAPGQMAPILADATQFQSRIRTCLMKGDGVGYIQPDSGLFPSLTSFHRLVVGCHALPCAAWLDGTTPTEERIEEWLGFLVAKGVVALNIIPDRYWYIAEAETRRI